MLGGWRRFYYSSGQIQVKTIQITSDLVMNGHYGFMS